MLDKPITPVLPEYEVMDIGFMKDLPNFGGFMVAKHMVHNDNLIEARVETLSHELVSDRKALMEYLAGRYNVIFPLQLARKKECFNPLTMQTMPSDTWFFQYGWAFGA